MKIERLLWVMLGAATRALERFRERLNRWNARLDERVLEEKPKRTTQHRGFINHVSGPMNDIGDIVDLKQTETVNKKRGVSADKKTRED